MGQKVSPVGLRIGINKDWESKWYAGNKDFAKYLNNDVQIRRFLEKKFNWRNIYGIHEEKCKICLVRIPDSLRIGFVRRERL